MNRFLRNLVGMGVLVVAASIVCHLIVPAFAQTTAPVLEYKIDLRPLLDVVWPLIAAVVAAGVSLLARKALGWLNLSEDRMVREYLEVAIVNGLELARQKLGSGPLTLTSKHQAVAEASGYVIARVPDALKRFDITEASLKRLVEARLGMIDPAPDGTTRLTSVK
jgi:hypothetical protein